MKLKIDIAGPWLLAIAAFTLSAPAGASATCPGALQQELGLAALPYPPLGCQLCHQTDAGGLKTATKPFGRAVQKDGAVAANVPSLIGALTTLETDGTDSDKDGVGDIAELKAGTDPNVAESSHGMPEPTMATDVPLPETGCSVTSAAARGGGLGLLFVGVTLSVARRRLLRRVTVQ
jgi:hypothetical protein